MAGRCGSHWAHPGLGKSVDTSDRTTRRLISELPEEECLSCEQLDDLQKEVAKGEAEEELAWQAIRGRRRPPRKDRPASLPDRNFDSLLKLAEAKLIRFIEVFVDKGQLTSTFVAEKKHAIAIGYHTGWDLDNKQHVADLLKLIAVGEVEDVWISFPCTPWSPWQTLNAAVIPGYHEILSKQRAHHDRHYLSLVHHIFSPTTTSRSTCSRRESRTKRSLETKMAAASGKNERSREGHLRPVHAGPRRLYLRGEIPEENHRAHHRP